MTEAKVIACWVASWGAGLGTFWILQGAVSGPEDNAMAGAMLGVAVVSIAVAVAAWLAVSKWWPE